MRIFLLFILCLFSSNLLPVDLDLPSATLDEIPFDKENPYNGYYLQMFVHKNLNNVYPQFINDGFYYVNIKAGEKVIPQRFNEAYPFWNKWALVKVGNQYAIIDSSGEYVLNPVVGNPRFPVYNSPNIVMLGDSIYEFRSGSVLPKTLLPSEIHADPPHPAIYIFEKDGKFGIESYEEEVLLKPQYDTLYTLDRQEFVAAKMKDKIGVINVKNEIVQPFEYTDIIIEESAFFTIYGLYKNELWYYFDADEPQKCITTSRHKISQFADRTSWWLTNILGLYKVGYKCNILYKDGSSLKHDYDRLNMEGTVGTVDGKTYIIFDKNERLLYYDFANSIER